ncbi:MAG: hypothetical protein Q8903_15455, partial [Bacteroidota bacterium]|nr:hypothetical protein [Bacteroidota bacterium]
YVNDLTGKLDPAQWTFSLTTKGIGLVKNSAGKIFASIKDGKFTCQVLKDGASTTLEEDVKNVILETKDKGKLVAKTENGNIEVEEGELVKGANDLADALKRWDNLSFEELTDLFSKCSKSDIRFTNNVTKSAKSANLEFELDYLKHITDNEGKLIDPQNFRPPYKKGSLVDEFELTEDALFIQCYDEYRTGSWIMSIEDFNSFGRNSDKIKNALALPTKPTKYSLVKVPSGTKIRKGTSAKIWDGIFKWGNGGTMQYQIVDFNYNTMSTWFKKLGDL